MSGNAAFSRRGALALVVGGFALFLAALYLIGAGEGFGGERGQGQAHAASNGLNGYAGLVRLVEAAGYDVERSRNQEGMNTAGLLVLTPGTNIEAEDIAKILNDRTFRGPTLVILPKLFVLPPSQELPPEAREKFKRGWVRLLGVYEAFTWPAELPAPYTFNHKILTKNTVGDPGQNPGQPDKPAAPARWSGMGRSGSLPTEEVGYAEPSGAHTKLITGAGGVVLAFAVPRIEPAVRRTEGEELPSAQPVIFLAEPDLANNYGLADATRAAAAVALVERLAADNDIDEVTFDLTLNGFGASENLLTLAFRPPFVAATLSLLVALLIVGWRAFRRFGPAAAPVGPDIAFGKRQLIANGAGLIVRARRFALLGAPYAALSARRAADRLGLARADRDAIDAALARRLPHEEPFTRRAARLEAAQKPADILAAAQSLDDLNTKLSQGQ